MDKISVILPVYKVEEYIHQSMESVLNQTYHNLEIILVDDGSPDNCGRICDEYASKDSRVIVIHKQNGGAPAARNDALAIATGEWIAYVDPDDWIEPTAFEEVMAVAKRENPDIVIFNTYMNNGTNQREIQAFPDDFVTEDREIIRGMQLSSLSKKYTPFLPNWSQGFPWDKLYKMSFMREHNILWPTNVKANDDVIYTIHAFQYANKVAYLNRTFYHYRYNPQSIGHKYMPDRVEVDHDIHVEMMNIRDMYGLGDEYSKALYSRVIRNAWLCCGRCFFHPDNPKKLSDRLKNIKTMMSDPIMKDAFRYVDRSKLDKNVMKALAFFKRPWPIWFLIVYKAYVFKEKLRK